MWLCAPERACPSEKLRRVIGSSLNPVARGSGHGRGAFAVRPLGAPSGPYLHEGPYVNLLVGLNGNGWRPAGPHLHEGPTVRADGVDVDVELRNPRSVRSVSMACP